MISRRLAARDVVSGGEVAIASVSETMSRPAVLFRFLRGLHGRR